METHQEIISGLHSCKPGNEPQVGQVKTFVVETKISKNGKPYQKIKSAGTEYGGQPYRILEAEPTGFTDKYGNLSYNLGIEPAVTGGDAPCGSEKRSTVVTSNAAQQVQAPSAAKFETYYGTLDERQRAIIRQHSQSMAIEVLKLKVTLNELTVEDITPAKLRKLTDYFDQDVIQPQTKNGGGNEREDLPEYQPEPF